MSLEMGIRVERRYLSGSELAKSFRIRCLRRGPVYTHGHLTGLIGTLWLATSCFGFGVTFLPWPSV
jgi:hypothetical protein